MIADSYYKATTTTHNLDDPVFFTPNYWYSELESHMLSQRTKVTFQLPIAQQYAEVCLICIWH